MDVTGTIDLGNQFDGVSLGNAGNNTIGGTGPGEGNTIAFSASAAGISVLEINGTSRGNAILGNSIHSNAGLGIELTPTEGVTPNDLGDADFGPNNLQNFPVLTLVTTDTGTTIDGTLNSVANTTFSLQFFSNATCDLSGFGEGENFIASGVTTTNASGDGSFSVASAIFVAAGQFITATATDPNNNTSEFSQCLTVS